VLSRVGKKILARREREEATVAIFLRGWRMEDYLRECPPH
jgi:hypothetical protein